MKANNKKFLTFLGIASLGLLLDQISKIWVANKMYLGESIALINNFVHITYVENRGIVFGICNGNVKVFFLVSLLGLGIAGGLIWHIYKNIPTFNSLKLVAYALILGGALGNSYDRFIRGYVIDFIDFRGVWGFIFNFADLIINIAIVLLFVDSYFEKKK